MIWSTLDKCPVDKSAPFILAKTREIYLPGKIFAEHNLLAKFCHWLFFYCLYFPMINIKRNLIVLIFLLFILIPFLWILLAVRGRPVWQLFAIPKLSAFFDHEKCINFVLFSAMFIFAYFHKYAKFSCCLSPRTSLIFFAKRWRTLKERKAFILAIVVVVYG